MLEATNVASKARRCGLGLRGYALACSHCVNWFSSACRHAQAAAFADAAALFDIAQRLDLVQLLDSILPPKRHQGISVGKYLLLAAINRAVSPTSKLQFADWYRQTVLTRLLPADPAALSSQNFWNHMDLVTADHVLECEK